MTCSGRSVFDGEWIELDFDRLLQSVEPVLGEAPGSDVWIAPGFIDLQVNGFAGVDYNSPASSSENIGRSLAAMFSTGVTRCFPTVITGPPEQMLAALRNLNRARSALDHGEAMEGFHVEGPHISPDDGPRGAHPVQWVRPPDLDEFQRWQDAAEGNVRLVTLAPEWPGAPRYIEALRGQGVVTSIGHTGATAAQIADAVRAGATLSTHLGNGTHATLPKTSNYIWDQLAEPRLAASLIVDGHYCIAVLSTNLAKSQGDRPVPVGDRRGGPRDVPTRRLHAGRGCGGTKGRRAGGAARRHTAGRVDLADGPGGFKCNAVWRRIPGRSGSHGRHQPGARGSHCRPAAWAAVGRAGGPGPVPNRGRQSASIGHILGWPKSIRVAVGPDDRFLSSAKSRLRAGRRLH